VSLIKDGASGHFKKLNKPILIPRVCLALLLALLVAAPALAAELYAHRSGCHRWHSCPSDRGTYTCGDTGHCSQCPDNKFCESGKPRRALAPVPRTAPSPPPKPLPPRGGFPSGFRTAKVIDGDTIRLASGERVRLIGVNSPEVHHPTRGQEPFGPEATQCLIGILGGQRVRLEVGVEPRDRYNRTLAHVFTEGDLYVNGELLRRGCARLMIIGLNTGHLGELVTAQEEAWKESRGVWGGWGNFRRIV